MQSVTHFPFVFRRHFGAALLAGWGLWGCGGGDLSTEVTGTVSPVTVSGGVNNTLLSAGAPTAITVSLNASRVSGVAPLAVSFDASGTASPSATSLPFHEIKYTWNFGDAAGGAGWAYGSRVGLSSKNAASGPIAAHVFETPGTYTVTLAAFDGANANSRTTTITVTDPNTVFSGTKTICVARGSTPVAGAGGCPAGAAVQNMPNWSTLANLANAYKRILLKADDVWTLDGSPNITSNGQGIIGKYGSGANPRVNMNSTEITGLLFSSNDWRVMDLVIGSSNSNNTDERVGVNINQSQNLLMLRTELFGVSTALASTGQSDTVHANNYYFVDSYVHDTQVRSTAAYLDKIDSLALLGSRFSRMPGGHGVRIQGTAKSVVSNCQIDSPKATSHVLTIRGKSNQPNPRGDWNGYWTEQVVVSDNVIDGSMGSIDALHLGPQAVDHGERLRDVIIERNIIKSNTSKAVYLEIANGATFRNNAVVTLGHYLGLEAASANNVGSPSPSSTYIYNNTFYKPNASTFNGYSPVHLYHSGSGARISGVVLRNNLAYAPGNTRDGTWSGSGATFLATSGGVTGYTMANNSSDAQVNGAAPGFSLSPVSYADWKIPGSSYAAGSGVAAPVWDDFLQASRVGIRSMGAILP